MLKQTRQCLHAGEWYTDNRNLLSYIANKLNSELGEYLNKAKN